VQWFNASVGTASHERAVAIRRELEVLPSEFGANAGAFVYCLPSELSERRRVWPKEKLRVQLDKRHTALNEILEQYVFRPRATCAIFGGWIFGMVPDDNKRWFQMTIGDETISEADVVMSLVRLAESRDLKKVRLCEMCKRRWLVAARRNYRFCSDPCREDFYAKAPDYHGRKAANQRKYRENLKRNLALHDFVSQRAGGGNVTKGKE
jgi:hypothetical protein